MYFDLSQTLETNNYNHHFNVSFFVSESGKLQIRMFGKFPTKLIEIFNFPEVSNQLASES